MSGRIRTLKPELLDDEKTAALDDAAFRLFVSAILLADDHGAFRATAAWLQSQIWWCSTPSRDPREALASLSESGLVTLYEHQKQTYGYITNWTRHQRVDHPSKPRLPRVNDEGSCILSGPGIPQCATNSRDTRETLDNPPESLAPDLRPPTSDLRPPTTDRREAARTECGAAPPGPLSADFVCDRAERQKRPGNGKRERPEPTDYVASCWKLWRSMYAKSRRKYGRYVEATDCKAAMGRIATRALDEARQELSCRDRYDEDPGPLVLEVSEHWFKSYLRDDGRQEMFWEARHPLRFLQRALTEYGLPKTWGQPVKPVDPVLQEAKRKALEAISQIGFDARDDERPPASEAPHAE